MIFHLISIAAAPRRATLRGQSTTATLAMKIDLFLPPGRHSWNLADGWVDTLQRQNRLGRAFHCTPENAPEILAHIPQSDADLMLLMGGDHHLHFLHDTPQKRATWQSTRAPRVAFCYESILDSRFPNSLLKTTSAIEACTHIAYCDENDAAFFENKIPAIWLPQCVDETRFAPGPEPRAPRVFFRGKTDLALHYDTRNALVQKLKTDPAFHFVDTEITDEQYAQSYSQRALALNLPGNFFGYNVRTFEALAAGCLLFQDRVPNRPRNEALFTANEILLYDPAQPDALIALVHDAIAHPEKYAPIARAGRDACLKSHTIPRRIEQILDFVAATYKTARRLHIGCAGNILPNYINIDVNAADPRVLRADAATLTELPDNHYAEIYASHVLEHFPHAATRNVLAAWSKKLRPGGALYLSVPDARFLALAHLTGTPLSNIVPPLMGGQDYAENFHYNAFDRKTLARHLRAAGFVNISLFDPRRHAFTQWDCSRWPLSLNLTACKPPAAKEQKFAAMLRQLRIILARYTRGLRAFKREHKTARP